MTHADPRKVVAEFADSMAATSHRIGEHGDASAYETLAAQTLHPADILTMARQVGQAMAARGYPEAGACVQLLAEIVGGDCPLHGGGEPSGPPIDGREVVRAPDVGDLEREREHDQGGTPHVPFTDRSCWCIGDDVETERYWARTPLTGGGSVPSPEADPPSPDCGDPLCVDCEEER